MLTAGLPEAFQIQAMACATMGSPFYAELLDRSRQDLVAGGAVAAMFDGWEGSPVPDAVVLRFMGAVHRLVLDGAVPDLARYYPSAGGQPSWPAAWEAFRTVIVDRYSDIRPRLFQQVQTNEVSRCAALLGGFLNVAARTGKPLRLLEIGSSAGLNLNWDRYRYELGESQWGDPESPVVIRSRWHGTPRSFAPQIDHRSIVAERAGCDISPVDIADPGQLRMLESFIWPEQSERFDQLRSAAALAKRYPPNLTRASAASWLRLKLSEPDEGVATVLFHSVMWWYLSEGERAEVTALIEQRGLEADQNRPFAWLQMELLRRQEPDILLRFWPGNEETLLGVTHPHGKEVWWEV